MESNRKVKPFAQLDSLCVSFNKHVFFSLVSNLCVIIVCLRSIQFNILPHLRQLQMILFLNSLESV